PGDHAGAGPDEAEATPLAAGETEAAAAGTVCEQSGISRGITTASLREVLSCTRRKNR
ncbi:MAG: hypothetical protein H6Q51_2228, partial [Deltaproteobacteria bacterium]|nr:hypothetical protein [Deltaproteobacteria bacterium]